MRINRAIRVDQVRLIGSRGEQVGIVSTNEALNMAVDAGLDLVEVSPNARPPVCKIMDYGKYQYQQKRKTRQGHQKQAATQMKELRFRPETDPHDLEIKVNRARKFLAKGSRVQFTLFFRGRQMLHKDQGYGALEKVVESLDDVAKVEREPKLSGKRLTMVVAPKA